MIVVGWGQVSAQRMKQFCEVVISRNLTWQRGEGTEANDSSTVSGVSGNADAAKPNESLRQPKDHNKCKGGCSKNQARS